jgi:histidine triad (HIT) family protein
VIPKVAIAKVGDMKKEDAELVGHLLFVAREVAAKEQLSDFRLVVNNGSGAGQTVFHLHVHLLGGRALTWPPG